MSEIKAFPVPSNANAWGMSLRDYFAAAALPTIIHMEGTSAVTGPGDRSFPNDVALQCYLLADAMLKAREGKP